MGTSLERVADGAVPANSDRAAPATDVDLVIAIVNASSGPAAGDDLDRRLRAVLKEKRLSWEIWPARDGVELSSLAQKAAASPAGIVVAGGGDGTVNAVASELAGTEKILGVLPLGTLNHFAKDLGIPLELSRAVDNIASGRSVRVDVGEVNGRIFLNNSSIGIYPMIVDRRDAQQRRGRAKWLAFISAMFRTLRQYTTYRVEVTADARRFSRRTPVLFVGNNEYQIEGTQLGARRRLDGGYLWLYVLHRTGRWGLFKFAVRAAIGRAWRMKDFDALKAREILVSTWHRTMRVAFDGEVAELETPLHYRIHPRALKVVVPATSDRQD